MSKTSNLAIAILAAGKGKRMGNPDIPKVMAELSGSPLIGHVLQQAEQLSPRTIVAIVGHHKEQVIEYCSEKFPTVEFAVQAEQLGTGHAVQQTESLLGNFDGDVLILSGDVPLLQSSTLLQFVEDHTISGSALSVLSCVATNPTGYGRIIRNTSGDFVRIVEEKDASTEEKLVAEINSGIYVVRASLLFSALQQVQNTNAQCEFYLTDIVAILKTQGETISAFIAENFDELQGINKPEELATAEISFAQRNKTL